jgi:hypothetical protein
MQKINIPAEFVQTHPPENVSVAIDTKGQSWTTKDRRFPKFMCISIHLW